MKKGGYQIIDLSNKSFTLGTGIVFAGIYNVIKNTHKPLYFSGIKIGSTKYHDTFIDVTLSSEDYIGTIYGNVLTIEKDDTVTISAPEE